MEERMSVTVCDNTVELYERLKKEAESKVLAQVLCDSPKNSINFMAAALDTDVFRFEDILYVRYKVNGRERELKLGWKKDAIAPLSQREYFEKVCNVIKEDIIRDMSNFLMEDIVSWVMRNTQLHQDR